MKSRIYNDRSEYERIRQRWCEIRFKPTPLTPEEEAEFNTFWLKSKEQK